MHPTLESITILHKCASSLGKFRGCDGLALPLKKVSIQTSANLVLRTVTAAKTMADELRRARSLDEKERQELCWLMEQFSNLAGVARYKLAEVTLHDITGLIGKASDFTAVEVHGVSSRGSEIQVDDANPSFFSVYLRGKDGMARCVGDFGVPKTAMEFAFEIAARQGLALKADNLMQDLVFQQLLASAA